MKLRTGFVTNSSSSSFLIALKRRPRSREDLYRMIYGLSYEDVEKLEEVADETGVPVKEGVPESWVSSRIVHAIYEGIPGRKLSHKELVEAVYREGLGSKANIRILSREDIANLGERAAKEYYLKALDGYVREAEAKGNEIGKDFIFVSYAPDCSDCTYHLIESDTIFMREAVLDWVCLGY